MRGKTIEIYLTNGTPRGIKFIEITNNIEQVIYVPRTMINEAEKHEEAKRAGVYFLFGENKESLKDTVYIGKSKNCIDRIKIHNKEKAFWQYAVLIISKDESFTATHIEFLEQIAIKEAKKIQRYDLDNEQNPVKSNISKSLQSELLNYFDSIKILLSTLGFKIFESIKKSEEPKNLFYCESGKIKADGEYQEDGFVVSKGSTAKKALTKVSPSIENLRNKLLNDKILIESEDTNILKFNENYLFNSPSAAATQVLARSANGWKEWKNNEGKTLDKIIRKE